MSCPSGLAGQEERVKVPYKPQSDGNSIMVRKTKQASFLVGVVFFSPVYFFQKQKKKALGNKITSVQYWWLYACLAMKNRLCERGAQPSRWSPRPALRPLHVPQTGPSFTTEPKALIPKLFLWKQRPQQCRKEGLVGTERENERESPVFPSPPNSKPQEFNHFEHERNQFCVLRGAGACREMKQTLLPPYWPRLTHARAAGSEDVASWAAGAWELNVGGGLGEQGYGRGGGGVRGECVWASNCSDPRAGSPGPCFLFQHAYLFTAVAKPSGL